ncbi:hypothetical protein KBY91_02320 [Streptomyces sp. RK23]|uniref:hypothetical protein n=1 Tax=Streptomyces TaxID=1883 RepID=UPI001B37C578|nr:MULTISPECIES: hypothetical protein [unclassified Streptomyces]MBQ0962925.1 hypothetical protein [Streptomyces sp. RK74B]MBQ1002258.1 hypothetical protein [Streptomyces sp. RK23]
MGKPDTRRLDREIRKANRKLAAVRERELWPLDSRERRAVMRAAASGGYRLHRGESTGRAESAMDTAWQAAETRLTAEITALQTERQRIVTEAARDKAAKKSSGWF